MKIEKPNPFPSERYLLDRRFVLHILPIKGLEENTIANKDTAALIAQQQTFAEGLDDAFWGN